MIEVARYCEERQVRKKLRVIGVSRRPIVTAFAETG
jgi:hypothetical protein